MSAAQSIRVAILGAESSGKSTLAAALAARYETLWVPEFLREFVETRQRVPQEGEQFFIASTQVERERAAAARAGKYLFCDTTPLMTALYSRSCFGRIDAPLAALTASHVYDITLVTAPDCPWVADGLQRMSESVRQSIHQQLLHELEARAVRFVLVEGPLPQRLLQIERLLSGGQGPAAPRNRTVPIP